MKMHTERMLEENQSLQLESGFEEWPLRGYVTAHRNQDPCVRFHDGLSESVQV